MLWSSSSLQLFLEASEGDFLLEVARGTHEGGGGAKKKLASTLQLFRDLGQSTANLVASGRHQDEEEDPDYLNVGLSCDFLYLFALALGYVCPHARGSALLLAMPA